VKAFDMTPRTADHAVRSAAGRNDEERHVYFSLHGSVVRWFPRQQEKRFTRAFCGLPRFVSSAKFDQARAGRAFSAV